MRRVQGLVEYALIMVLVAFTAVVTTKTLANDINKAFLGVGTILSSYLPQSREKSNGYVFCNAGRFAINAPDRRDENRRILEIV